MTHEDQDQPPGCGCENHNPTPHPLAATDASERGFAMPDPLAASREPLLMADPATAPSRHDFPALGPAAAPAFAPSPASEHGFLISPLGSAPASEPGLPTPASDPATSQHGLPIPAPASAPAFQRGLLTSGLGSAPVSEQGIPTSAAASVSEHRIPASAAAAAPASRRRFLRTATGLAISAPAMLAAACGSSSSPSSATAKQNPTSGTQPSSGAPSQPSSAPSGSTSGPGGTDLPGPETADPALLASRYRGLKPFAPAPPPPATKPVNTNVDLPPVITHIPTDQKICFLTIDDGAEKDPAFLQMVKDFRIPITMFLADCFIHDDYSYFTKLRDTGYCTIQNHTLHHPDMTTLSAQRQLAEVSGQQQKLVTTYDTHPYLFRAPFGNSNKATQEACKQNGLKAICYWRATFQKQGFQWQAADKKLRPGDILLAHFRGPKANGKGWPEMHELMTNLFRIVQDQGYTFARLEDYV